MLESLFMMLSVMPSARYSLSASPLMMANGRTASESMGWRPGGVVRIGPVAESGSEPAGALRDEPGNDGVAVFTGAAGVMDGIALDGAGDAGADLENAPRTLLQNPVVAPVRATPADASALANS